MVYGSGRTCQWILNNNKSVKFAWLEQSTGWAGYKDFNNWNIKQGSVTTILGISFDKMSPMELVGDKCKLIHLRLSALNFYTIGKINE